MKKFPLTLKFVLSTIFIFTFLHNSFSQIIPKEIRRVLYPLQSPERASNFLNCTPVILNGCNFIANDDFTPSAAYNVNLSSHIDNPFNFDFLGNTLVPSWDIATGTPTIYDGVFHSDPLPPPTPTPTGYFFGGTGYDNSSGGFYSESIVQKIPALTPNKAYTLSFYKMFKDYSYLPPNISNPLDHFRIVLMKCSDYTQTFRPITYQVPTALPANSQVIYCETEVSNATWNQVFIKFTPNQAYDLIWIYPEGDHDVIPKYSGLFASFPELIDVGNFSAGPAPNPTPPNCNVTIGPATPNCGPTGAVFTWTGPQGQTPTVPVNQQITFDASIPANAGTWTLSMTMPDATITNSLCGEQEPIISASVNVALCSSTCTLPTITPLGPTTQCIWYETGPWLTLTTNLTSNIQWYDDGVPIYQGNTQTITLTNNPGSANTWPTFTGNITVKNTLFTNCISQPLTVTRKNYSTPWAYPGSINPPGTPSQYCKSQPSIVRQINSISDPNTIFWWEVLDPNNNPASGVSINPIFTTNSTANISFANYNYSSATIIAKSSDNGCSNLWNYSYPVTINQSCLLESNLNLQLFPNPASTQITIFTNNNALIQSVEIGDLFALTLKRIKVNNTKSITINVFDLNPGIYNCKITTSKGTENQKLIIKR